ncbi:thiamine phosphate synthase [Vibrio fluvialis]|uniref:thiamine phosphate synthase n=1 Tax=Vibrio sp. bablab_jr001 TaxID=2755067 RepID=UPI0018F18805|nr:thiamine phosphate synthase [Vibrio sp. bablab_jr001]EKO3397226.1 thiamine phosphate synthase [Vibrio fluvialis]EKO3472321.1 thiamine phosphate synthase [Vibrio fluvialis]MBY8114171.1 thiamine phosphate synthase [Vibrio fluvialis]MBY8247159.1 thiamine phosphate synthase [Vibrio fluvialis]MBY8280813.1 thiamine phosphate synthase [Vibrio fluvialis]
MTPYTLYLVTDDQQDLGTLCHVVQQAIAGGVSLVQVREKQGDVRTFIERAAAVKAVLSGSGVPLIINDRVDVALAVDADGVHLGQSDMPATLARQLLGPDKLIGLSVENEQQFEQAQSLPVDYLGLSAIFATPTKINTVKHWGLDGLNWAMARSRLPMVAIGGLNTSNIGAVAQTGVQGIALVSAISHARDPQQAAHDLRLLIEQNRPASLVRNY